MTISLWSDWGTFSGAVVSAAITYVFTVVAVRITGRRTLAQLSAYDVIVTVAIGTLAASTALPSNPALADGAAVLVTFLLLQVVIGALRQRLPRFRRLVDFAPLTVVRDGQVDLRSAPWTAQLTVSELESRLRQNGVGDLSGVRLVVLEPTGKMSVAETEPGELFRKVTTR